MSPRRGLTWCRRLIVFGRFLWACPRCAGSGCCATRRAAVEGSSSRPFRAAIPHAGSPPPSALAGAQGGAGLRRGAPGQCARQCSDQGCAFIAMRNSRGMPAVPAGMTTAARSRARGSRAWFPSRVRERGPLDELTGVPFTPLRFVRCTPARSSPRSPATPDAGPLKSLGVFAPARLLGQSLRLVSRRRYDSSAFDADTFGLASMMTMSGRLTSPSRRRMFMTRSSSVSEKYRITLIDALVSLAFS